LDINGLSNKWNDGVLVSDWEGELGQMDFNGLRESIPNVIAQLSTNLDPQNYDLSNTGPGEDVVGELACGDRGEQEEEEEIVLGQMSAVNSMSLVLFRRKLIDHFSITSREGLRQVARMVLVRII
jgi:hypothetical protein